MWSSLTCSSSDFLDRTPQGRTATQLAYEHLGLDYPKEPQARLFD